MEFDLFSTRNQGSYILVLMNYLTIRNIFNENSCKIEISIITYEQKVSNMKVLQFRTQMCHLLGIHQIHNNWNKFHQQIHMTSLKIDKK